MNKLQKNPKRLDNVKSSMINFIYNNFCRIMEVKSYVMGFLDGLANIEQTLSK